MKTKLQAICYYLEQGLIERAVPVRLALLAAISGEHLLLLGPPGTAKSELARKLHRVFSGVNYFERLLTRFSVPEELFGPLSIKALEDDRYQRLTKNYLPEASIAFIDEVFKANSAILNALLTLLNEREFDNGAERLKTPLISVIAASNELPEDESLAALYDRFLLRYQLGPISDKGFNSLLDLSDQAEFELVETLAEDELNKIQLQAAELKLSTAARDLLFSLRKFLLQQNIYISDRRWRKILKILKTAAATNKQSLISPWDCALILHCCWQSPEQLKILQQWFVETMQLDMSEEIQRFEKLLDTWQQKLDKDKNKRLQQTNEQGQKLYIDDNHQIVTHKQRVTLAERDNELLYLAPTGQADPSNKGRGYTLSELEKTFFDDAMQQTHIDGKWVDLQNYVNNTQNRLVDRLEFEPLTHSPIYTDEYIAASLDQLRQLQQDVQHLYEICLAKYQQAKQETDGHLWLEVDMFSSYILQLKQDVEKIKTIQQQLSACCEGFASLPVKDTPTTVQEE